jgi:diguanylate cyclase (GGDEF)-like protein
VLIAEDDPLFRRILEAKLQEWGYEVVAVDSGTKAWELLETQLTPDLLILDWMMPGIDGIELCRRIRSGKADRYQYILLISGKDEKREVVQGLDAGADDYLTKPFDIGEFHARIRAGNRILALQRDLMQALDALRYQATHDDLTGLWSRGPAMHLLKRDLERGMRSGSPTGVLLVDLDHFKKINDTYGHLSGDIVLKEAASRINRAVRSYDFVGRYGGEEFMAVLSNCSANELQIVAERVRSTVGETPICVDGTTIRATASIGGAVALHHTNELALMGSADEALYEAKQNGRNRVVIASEKRSDEPIAVALKAPAAPIGRR